MLRGAFFLVAMVLISIGFWVDADDFSALGIMTNSLNSDVALTRDTALITAAALKWSIKVLGYLLAFGTFFWPWISQTELISNFMARDLSHPRQYEAGLAKKVDLGLVVLLVGILFSLIYLVTADQWLSAHVIGMINREDGLIEYVSAVLLIIASGYAAFVAIKAEAPNGLRRFHGFLALLFFVMCGEEISWGQRILQFETPDAIRDVNVQSEANLHNMFGYVFDHLFILCFFVWGCVLPLLYAVSPFMRNVLRLIRLPLPSVGLAIGMFLVTLFQDEIIGWIVPLDLPGLRLPELREMLSAMAFLLMMQQSATALIPSKTSKEVDVDALAKN